MKKTVILSPFVSLSLAVALLVVGCKKEQNNPDLSPQEEQEATLLSMESEAEAQWVFNDIFESVTGMNTDLGLAGAGIFGRTAATGRTEKLDSVATCVQVSLSPLQPDVFPKTLVLDFGTGCRVGGHFRAGKLTTVYSGRLSQTGASATTTFENFFIDSVAVEGTHKLTNTTSSGQRQFTIEVTNARLTRANGAYREWSTTRVHTQLEGGATAIHDDDVFSLAGNSSGKTKSRTRELAWNTEITHPLVKRASCRWISQGTIKTVRTGLTANSQWAGILDFGAGTCDNTAILTINGNDHQIVLR